MSIIASKVVLCFVVLLWYCCATTKKQCIDTVGWPSGRASSL